MNLISKLKLLILRGTIVRRTTTNDKHSACTRYLNVRYNKYVQCVKTLTYEHLDVYFPCESIELTASYKWTYFKGGFWQPNSKGGQSVLHFWRIIFVNIYMRFGRSVTLYSAQGYYIWVLAYTIRWRSEKYHQQEDIARSSIRGSL